MNARRNSSVFSPEATLPHAGRARSAYSSVAATSLLACALLFPLGAGCNQEVKAYEKKPAPTAKAPGMPAPPTLPQKAKKEGDAYTVFGLVHDFHSKVHSNEVKGKKVTVVGYIVKTNLVECKNDANAVEEGCVHKCAVPEDVPKGKPKPGTPADCKAPPPTFYIADSPDEKTGIPVMGWATNFAGIKYAMAYYDDDKEKKTCEKPEDCKAEGTQCNSGTCVFADQNGKVLPDPIPAVGAKVKVSTDYGTTYKGFNPPASDPKFGILGPKAGNLVIEVVQQAPQLATLPYAKERKAPKDKPGDKKDDKKDDKGKKDDKKEAPKPTPKKAG